MEDRQSCESCLSYFGNHSELPVKALLPAGKLSNANRESSPIETPLPARSGEKGPKADEGLLLGIVSCLARL